MEEVAVKIFGTPLNWNLNPNSELLKERVEKLRPSLMESVQKLTLPSKLKHELDDSSGNSPSKRVKVEEPPTRGSPPNQPVFDDPMHVDAVFFVEKPKTPEIPVDTGYSDAAALEEEEPPVELLQVVSENVENLVPTTENVAPEMNPEIILNDSESPIALTTVVKLKPEPSVQPLRERISNKDLNTHYPTHFTGKFKIQVCEDPPPVDEEYEEVVIAPREKIAERKRQEPKRYNDADFEDIDEEGNVKKPKQPRKRKATLESQFGVEKGRVILRLVTDPETVKLLVQPQRPIVLCDRVANKQLAPPKSSHTYIPVHVGDYYYGHISKTPNGVYLIALFKLAMKNILLRKRSMQQTVLSKFRTTPQSDEETKQLAELMDPDRIYSFLDTLCNNLRRSLEQALPRFIHYKELLPVADIPGEKMPRNSLELILLYNEFRVVHETGLEPESFYIAEFSEPRVLITALPFSQVYRLKYQQMVQFYWLYLLLHPQKLINTIANQILIREEDTLERLSKSQPKFNVNVVVKDLIDNTRGALTMEFLETYITFVMNAESLFGVECYKKLFKDYHITAEMPRTQSISSLLKQPVK